ncbi:Septin-domain-containing protein [Hyaloraphidium curvatum]|nr:Septin-domain-containing protein [Hyaloraphidium curvatum]
MADVEQTQEISSPMPTTPPSAPAPSTAPVAAVTQQMKKMSVANQSYVGFETLPNQIVRKRLKEGFRFNIMIVGASGLGKTTLVNTMFAAHLVDSKATKHPTDPWPKTTEIASVTHLLEENGVRLRLTIVDTPGYGDQVNNENCWDPVLRYIKEQYAAFLRKELTPARDRRIPDTRIHCVLFFIAPSGHALRPIDITVMRKLTEVANVIPVIAKSDSLTPEEKDAFKRRIKAELDFHGIRAYPFPQTLEDIEGWDTADEREYLSKMRDMLPFAVIGSETVVQGAEGPVRGRKTRWGVVNVEEEKHSDFVHLRQFLTRTHLQDLIETTHYLHYEQFRTRQLLALKEGGGAALAQQQQASQASLVPSGVPAPAGPSPGQ